MVEKNDENFLLTMNLNNVEHAQWEKEKACEKIDGECFVSSQALKCRVKASIQELVGTGIVLIILDDKKTFGMKTTTSDLPLA